MHQFGSCPHRLPGSVVALALAAGSEFQQESRELRYSGVPAGACFVDDHDGDGSGDLVLLEADRRWCGQDPSNQRVHVLSGTTLTQLSEFDRRADLTVANVPGAGLAWLAWSRGEVDRLELRPSATAPARWSLSSDQHALDSCSSVRRVGDLDGDGVADLALPNPWAN